MQLKIITSELNKTACHFVCATTRSLKTWQTVTAPPTNILTCLLYLPSDNVTWHLKNWKKEL